MSPFDAGVGDYGYAIGTSSADRAKTVERAAEGARGGSNGWLRANCPFCPDRVGKVDTKYCLSIREDSGVYRCWRCGVKGRVAELATRLSGDGAETWPERVRRGGDVFLWLGPPEGFCSLGRESSDDPLVFGPARAYLVGRGLRAEVAYAAGLGACLGGAFAGRIIIPVLDGAGMWLGWIGRDYTGRSERPYHTCSGMPKAEMLYNQAAVFVETDAPVYVVEGVFDALALWPDGVAVFGKPSATQERILLHSARPVVIVLDGDAWRESEAMMWRLRIDGHRRVGFVRLPSTIDPDEVPRAWLDEEAKRCLVQ